MCELFFWGALKGAREGGRFSAEKGLKGVCRIFVKLGSPEFLIRKASTIFTSYYQPSEMKVAAQEDRKAVVHITKFSEPSALIENRLAGWMKKGLEISGCKNVMILLTNCWTKEHPARKWSPPGLKKNILIFRIRPVFPGEDSGLIIRLLEKKIACLIA